MKQFNAELSFPLYLFSALIGTDGCITEIDKGLGFALNFRRIQEYGEDELKIVIAHEFFHVYQHDLQKNENQGPRLERGIFAEGWATYASSIISPGYPDWKYISYSKKDDQQYKEFQKYQKEIASEFLRLLNSDKYEDYRRFFNADVQYSKPWPPRSGYFLGYTVAKNLERKMKPKDIALMKYSEFQKILKGELENLAK